MKNKKKMVPKNIKNSYRVVITLIFMLIFLVIVVTMFNYQAFRDQLIKNEQAQLLTIAETTADRISYYVEEIIQDSVILKQTIVEEYKTSADLYDVVTRTLNNYYKIQNGKIYKLQFLSQSGELIYESIDIENALEEFQELEQNVIISNYTETPTIGQYYYLKSGELAVDIITKLVDKNQSIGYLRMTIEVEDIYNRVVKEIKIGEKGYASVKDSNGVLLMHPKKEDIGLNVMIARKQEFPDYDWSELDAIVALQKQGKSGTGIYHSIWYHDEHREYIKKFSAYAPAVIGDGFWMVTVSMDYKELDDLASKYFFSNSLLAGFFPLILTVLLVYILNLKKNLLYLENEQRYVKKVNLLNRELEADIEERKLLEKELIRSKTRFKELFNAGNDMSFAIELESDLYYAITQVNEMACREIDISRKDLIGRSYLSVVDMNKDELNDIVNKILIEGKAIFEASMLTENKQIIPVEIGGTVFVLDGNQTLMLVARDISKKKEQEAQIEKNRALLIYKFRMVAMGEMIANIAHQWRQPLGSLSLKITNLEDARIHGELNQEEFEKYVSSSQMIIKSMSDIIDEFRYFFNPNNDKVDFLPELEIQNAIEMVRDRITIDGINITVVSHSSRSIYGFSNQFSQVILNILNNSIDALSHKNNGERHIKIDLSNQSEFAVKVIVTNNGQPLEEGTETKVFDPYFTTKQSKGGTGIGLYMTKMIIESNFGGSIQMQNVLNGVQTTIVLNDLKEAADE